MLIGGEEGNPRQIGYNVVRYFIVLNKKSHDHYGSEVQACLVVFQDAWLTYQNYLATDKQKVNSYRLDSIQELWDSLVKARKKETNAGFYLPEKIYRNLRN